jgi:glycosyltransferase involved in cell wall biosynthesis
LSRQRDELLIGYVGRIVEEKGLRTLVGALARLPRTSWRLVLIGAGPFEQNLDALFAQAGISDRVLKLGFVPHEDTPKYLAAFDLLVIPSETQKNWKEQYGRVIVEALACGTPVVGSDSGEIPNLIRSSGGGLVFAERNAEALAASLQEMMTSSRLREEFAERGRRWVVTNVSLQAVAEKIAATMERAAAPRCTKTSIA